jgi:hypothetical protein
MRCRGYSPVAGGGGEVGVGVELGSDALVRDGDRDGAVARDAAGHVVLQAELTAGRVEQVLLEGRVGRAGTGLRAVRGDLVDQGVGRRGEIGLMRVLLEVAVLPGRPDERQVPGDDQLGLERVAPGLVHDAHNCGLVRGDRPGRGRGSGAGRVVQLLCGQKTHLHWNAPCWAEFNIAGFYFKINIWIRQ